MFYIVTEKRIIMGNQENKLYHFVGIKGSGMSSLALVLHQKGYNVQGSDVEEYFFTPVSYTHLTLPTNVSMCRSRWSPYH